MRVDERVEALRVAEGKSDAECERAREEMALFLAKPAMVNPASVLSLDLDGQMLRNIRLGAFKSLRQLRLRGNLLKSIKDIGIQNMKQLRGLDLRDNLLPLEIAAVLPPSPLF